ncbi:MarR family winged helix-turn-helix transcriptional regulator [Granulicella sp. dw_53]|uniref:MarR family winged helix-turn-helix transcriptional regulator n=1 Tax=Granulicella sp. dw_53 TaxID=2719792 RepID=UPI001BD491AC|nr:MarR family winged helix-turn-helix transcriptional regulator [Granulicella sp. dw_53]
MAKTLDFTEITCNATAMRKASRRVTQFYDTVLAPSGLRSTQMVILAELFLQRDSPPTMTQLADVMVLDRSALGHNLRPLERDGLIELQESPADRRHRHILLTRRGKAKIAEAYPLWRQAQKRFASIYGEDATKELRKILLSIAHDDRLKTLAFD